jgi:hypothetical protein
MSAGLYSSASSAAVSMTSVSASHCPVPLVEDPAPAPKRPVRSDGEVVRIVVDQDQAAEVANPALVGRHEPLELLARANQEVGPLDLGVAGHVGEGGVASSFHVRPPTGEP